MNGDRPLYLTPDQVAGELGISRGGVYKLVERGKLPAIRLSERNLRIPFVIFEAYKRRLNAGRVQPAPVTDVEAGRARPASEQFAADAGMSPEEWLSRWKADEVEDSAANMELTIRALSAMASAKAAARAVEPALAEG